MTSSLSSWYSALVGPSSPASGVASRKANLVPPSILGPSPEKSWSFLPLSSGRPCTSTASVVKSAFYPLLGSLSTEGRIFPSSAEPMAM